MVLGMTIQFILVLSSKIAVQKLYAVDSIFAVADLVVERVKILSFKPISGRSTALEPVERLKDRTVNFDRVCTCPVNPRRSCVPQRLEPPDG